MRQGKELLAPGPDEDYSDDKKVVIRLQDGKAGPSLQPVQGPLLCMFRRAVEVARLLLCTPASGTKQMARRWSLAGPLAGGSAPGGQTLSCH